MHLFSERKISNNYFLLKNGKDLNLSVKIVIPTVRDNNGLALSLEINY